MNHENIEYRPIYDIILYHLYGNACQNHKKGNFQHAGQPKRSPVVLLRVPILQIAWRQLPVWKMSVESLKIVRFSLCKNWHDQDLLPIHMGLLISTLITVWRIQIARSRCIGPMLVLIVCQCLGQYCLQYRKKSLKWEYHLKAKKIGLYVIIWLKEQYLEIYLLFILYLYYRPTFQCFNMYRPGYVHIWKGLAHTSHVAFVMT